MYKAIITKELLKTKRTFWCCLAIAVFFTGYALLGINRVITLHGVSHVWLIMLMKDQVFIDAIKYVPLVCGLLIGLSQMIPEMQQNRLKLTLHLPVPQLKILMTMLATGAGLLTLIFLLQSAAILIYYNRIVAPEMTLFATGATLPWYLAGYTAYFFSTAVCLEGQWRRRIILALTGAGAVTVYFLQSAPGAYTGILPAAVVLTAMLALLSHVSVTRFKKGLID